MRARHGTGFLETALPLAPTLLSAGLGGVAIGAWYSSVTGVLSVPAESLLVPAAVYVACVSAAATTLPALGRSVRPAELRYT
ncbi:MULTISPECIES: hypothetical protein [unclassified Streptomyces]|uniref:hypothetical protein n=1 Tax=unclassified Streptomyces TaxID=2593676 RepID=UPI001903E955|nr:hypothetical protein [Streptomyces sp. HSG2]